MSIDPSSTQRRLTDPLHSGFVIAKDLAANGAKVYITGRREETLRAAAASVSAEEGVLISYVAQDGSHPTNVLRLRMDVTDQASVNAATEHIQAADGRLDNLVNKYAVT